MKKIYQTGPRRTKRKRKECSNKINFEGKTRRKHHLSVKNQIGQKHLILFMVVKLKKCLTVEP